MILTTIDTVPLSRIQFSQMTELYIRAHNSNSVIMSSPDYESDDSYDDVGQLTYAQYVLTKTRETLACLQDKMILTQSHIRICEKSVRCLESSPAFIPQNIFNIKQYDFSRLPPTGCIVVFGGTTLTWPQYILSQRNHRVLLVSDGSGTHQAARWSTFGYPFDIYEASVVSLQRLRDEQYMLVQQYQTRNEPFPDTDCVTLVFEISMSNQMLLKSSIMEELAVMGGHHYQMLIIFIAGYNHPIPPIIRCQFDFVILLESVSVESKTIKRIYHEYCSHILNQRAFRSGVFVFATFDDGACVINNQVRSTNIQDVLFYGIQNISRDRLPT